MPSTDLVKDAYEATKDKNDPPFYGAQLSYRDELQTRADAVIRTKLTINPFEEKVLELYQKQQAEQPKTQLGTTNTLDEAVGNKSTDNSELSVSDDATLTGKKRSELDEIATGLGLNPTDYKNMSDEVAAIEEARAKVK